MRPSAASSASDQHNRPPVIAGLDPAIHPIAKKWLNLAKKMDPRVKPAGNATKHQIASRGFPPQPIWTELLLDDRFAKALKAKDSQREETTMRRIALASTTLLALCMGAQAADQVKLGNLTQLSGPISPAGTETKRGIDLALEELGNKLGGLPVKYTVVDDKTNPAEAVQGASKLIDDAKVDFVTGLGASNTLIPVFKSFVNAGIFTVGALAGPLQFAGKECHPNGFFVSFTNDDWPAAAGKYMSDKGIKSAFFLGADYQAGYEHVGAAIKYFKGKAIGPVYTPLSQLDFAPEIARIRAEKPDAVFAFLVGAGGVAFSKQYAQAGLQSQIPFYTEDPVANPLTFPAQGDAALGIIVGTNWTVDLDNAANKKFVAAFMEIGRASCR